jgi:hypothetical protein
MEKIEDFRISSVSEGILTTVHRLLWPKKRGYCNFTFATAPFSIRVKVIMKILQLILMIFISIYLISCSTMEPSETEVVQNRPSEKAEPADLNEEDPLLTQQPDSQYQNTFIHLQGIVHKITKLNGTLSEYSYYVIKTGLDEIVLFNTMQKSMGFDIYLEKEIEIHGTEIIGTIGWRKSPAKGLQVEKIFIKE